MRNSWTRAWLATLLVLVGSSALVRSRHTTIIKAEDLVMDWILEGTDVSGWGRLDVLGSLGLIIPATVILAVVMMLFNRVAGLTLLLTLFFGIVLGRLVKNFVGRPRPTIIDGVETSSFPSQLVVQAGVFWGLVALAAWWFGAPRLLWQIVVEACVVLVLLIAVGRVVQGYSWPSDMVGSALVAALALVSGAIILEDQPRGSPKLPWSRSTPRSSSGSPPSTRWSSSRSVESESR